MPIRDATPADAATIALLLLVLRANTPRRGFYEALGAVLVGDQAEKFAGTTLHEVAYGWPDLTLLQRQTRQTT